MGRRVKLASSGHGGEPWVEDLMEEGQTEGGGRASWKREGSGLGRGKASREEDEPVREGDRPSERERSMGVRETGFVVVV